MATKERTATAIRFPTEVHTQLREAATEYDLTVNWLVVQAVKDFLENRVPADELSFRKPKAEVA